jgi:HNH endonuclease
MRCIFCRNTPTPPHRLTDEHSIPFALGGKSIIKNATCERCRDLTSRVETNVLKGMMYAYRFKSGIQSRSKKPPRTLPLFAINGDDSVKIDVLFLDYPSVLALPVFRDFFVIGRENTYLDDLPWLAVDRDSVSGLFEKYGISSFSSPALDVRAFGQMVCKIAHCLALEYFGKNFTPYISEMIFSQSSDDFRKFVRSSGGQNFEGPINLISHSWNFKQSEIAGAKVLRCDLNLFASYGAPIYEVLVGEVGPFDAVPKIGFDFPIPEPPYGSDRLRVAFGKPGILNGAQDIRRCTNANISLT